MAEVHIVDIDGEQWDIKDLPLTQRVATLEAANEVKQLDVTKNNLRVLGYKQNKVVTLLFTLELNSSTSGRSYSVNDILPQGWRPTEAWRAVLINNNTDKPMGQVTVSNQGAVSLWSSEGSFSSNITYVASVSYIAP